MLLILVLVLNFKMSNYHDIEDFTNQLQFKSSSTPNLNKSQVYNKNTFLRGFLKLFKSQNNISIRGKKMKDKTEVLSVSLKILILICFC